MAKNKLREVAFKIEKALYHLKYGDRVASVLDDELFYRIKDICKEEGLDFPLSKDGDNYIFNGDLPNAFCIASKLADDYDIILRRGDGCE